MSQVITLAGASSLLGWGVRLTTAVTETATPRAYMGVWVDQSTGLSMQLTTLAVPTARLVHLGLFPQRFFRNNQSIEVLQALRLGGEDLTLLVRIRRRRGGPTGRGGGRRGRGGGGGGGGGEQRAGPARR